VDGKQFEMLQNTEKYLKKCKKEKHKATIILEDVNFK